ncbi:MAG: DUF2189 domain-containing protein [Rhodospirillales bacterium]|nr:DUF2189 domain-containing protein [Rhodospirillales bacterium]
MANKSVSMSYAGLFIAFGLFLSFGFHFLGWPYLILPGLSGFLLVGPAVGVGFYEISRRHELGEKATFLDTLLAFRRNTWGIMGMGIALVFLFQVWIRLSFTIFALNFPGVMPEWSDIFARAMSMEGVYFGIYITALGSVFSTLIFFAAGFAMPLMLDRKTILIPSMIASVYAIFSNKSAMILWAGLIVIFTGLGLALACIGLIVTLPLIGHATWHAYKQVMSGDKP